MSSTLAAQNAQMINHPAMPKFGPVGITPYQRDMANREGAELAFQSVVKWLEEPCKNDPHGRLWIGVEGQQKTIWPRHRRTCPKCMQSLRKAARLEKP